MWRMSKRGIYVSLLSLVFFTLLFSLSFLSAKKERGKRARWLGSTKPEKGYVEESTNVKNLLKETSLVTKKRSKNEFVLSHHQFHDGAGARAQRWVATMMASRFLGIQPGFERFENGSGISSIIEGDKYCHKYATADDSFGRFHCYENKWDDFLMTHKYSKTVFEKPVCKLNDRGLSVSHGKAAMSVNTYAEKAKEDYADCDNGFHMGGSGAITMSLEKHSGYYDTMKQVLGEWQEDLQSFPRPGFPTEPKCSYSPDHVNMAIHLRRGDKRKSRHYPVGKQNLNLLAKMHTIAEKIDPDLYKKLVVNVDEDTKSYWRSMGPPIKAEKRISFHIFTEADECPIEVSHKQYLDNIKEVKGKDEYVFRDMKLTKTLSNKKPLQRSVIGSISDMVFGTSSKESSRFPSSGQSGGLRNESVHYLFEDLAMWDLEYQPCGFSYFSTCPKGYHCYGMYRSRCQKQYHCDSLPSGVWKVKSGRGDGYLPHEIFIHINGQPENDVYCIGQADIIWSSCSTFSQLSLMMSPLGQAIKIYSSDCKLPVERQQVALASAEKHVHWHATKNERVPVLVNQDKFESDLKNWISSWTVDRRRRHRKAFQGWSPQILPSTATDTLQSEWIYWDDTGEKK